MSFQFCIKEIKLRLIVDPSSGEVRTEVSAMCTILPFYGVPDLVEILGWELQAAVTYKTADDTLTHNDAVF